MTDMIGVTDRAGFRPTVTDEPTLNRATGWFEIGDLLLLNELVALNYARPVYPGIGNFEVPPTGLVNSQGDRAMRSDFVRLGYDIDGAGVKIGVLSNSYNTLGKALEDVGNGDLPGATNPNGYLNEVDVLLDVTPSFGTLSDERKGHAANRARRCSRSRTGIPHGIPGRTGHGRRHSGAGRCRM
jgi:hypothetical protein